MPVLVSAMLLVVAVIHLLPAVGAFGPRRLSALYGLDFEEPNLAILMRHRAVLFGMLGVLFAAAAFVPALQVLAFGLGFVSVVSFLVLAKTTGGYNPRIRRVVLVDWVALGCLVVGALAGVSS